LLEDKPKVNISLPVKKKAKSDRGTIMSFFNNKKTDEHKENNSRHRSKSAKKTQTKTKEPEQQPITIVSSVHVEKTSLILFDEV
jgi:hypothetical protein